MKSLADVTGAGVDKLRRLGIEDKGLPAPAPVARTVALGLDHVHVAQGGVREQVLVGRLLQGMMQRRVVGNAEVALERPMQGKSSHHVACSGLEVWILGRSTYSV